MDAGLVLEVRRDDLAVRRRAGASGRRVLVDARAVTAVRGRRGVRLVAHHARRAGRDARVLAVAPLLLDRPGATVDGDRRLLAVADVADLAAGSAVRIPRDGPDHARARIEPDFGVGHRL